MEYKSLLETTQNTRDLGGYETCYGRKTKSFSVLRSDRQGYASDRDKKFLVNHDITTVIDMRTEEEDVKKKPSSLTNVKGMTYYNFPVYEGSKVPNSVEEVPFSFLKIAEEPNMKAIFECIANAPQGVIFNCSAGKDRSGVVSAVLLLFAGAKDEDIIENYVVTKYYIKQRLEYIKQNSDIDMAIVTPNKYFMEMFLKMFREKYGDVSNYFQSIGMDRECMDRLKEKFV